MVVAAIVSGPSTTGMVDWDAPLACPDQARFEALVRDYLGRELDPSEGHEALVAEARVAPRFDGWGLQLRVFEARGARSHQLWGPDCELLARQAAALTATSLDPFGFMTREPEPDPSEVIAVVPLPLHVEASEAILVRAADPTPSPEPEPKPSEPTATALQFELEPIEETTPEPTVPRGAPRPLVGVAAGLGLGLLGVVRPGVHGRVGLGGEHWRASFHGGADFGRFRAPGTTEVGGDLTAWALGLRGCGVAGWSRITFHACASSAAGAIHGRGVGLLDPQPVVHPWIWLGPELGIRVELGASLGLTFDFATLVSVARPAFEITEPSASFETPLVAARLGLGLEIRIPRLHR